MGELVEEAGLANGGFPDHRLVVWIAVTASIVQRPGRQP
jgi:hypothetical protein